MSKQITNKIHHILFISSKQKSSFEIIYQIYLIFLERKQPIKMYSLDSFGNFFERIVPMENNQKNLKLIDFVVVVGDNETLMNSAQNYNFLNTPPILGIGNGSGPGLYNFNKYQAKQVANTAIDKLVSEDLFTQQIMKISCNINCKALGESICQVQIHRGMDQPILILNLYLENNKKEKIKIGQFRGDGLLISTPMGSYCKSLSLNGPVMCKTMQNIMITPICPLSMKFRPICLPSSTRLFMEIDNLCRTQYANIYLDENKNAFKLMKGEITRIKMSKYTANLISNLQQSCQQLFIKSLKTILWGQSYQFVQTQQILKKKMSLNYDL